MTDVERRAVRFLEDVLSRAKDWQDGQHALADHEEFGPYLEETGDPVAAAQSLIRVAEDRLGKRLPY